MFVLLALALLGCSTEAPPAPPATPPATVPAEPPPAATDAATATDATAAADGTATDAAATDAAATDAAATDAAATTDAVPPAEGATTAAADPAATSTGPAATPGVSVVGAPIKPGTGVKVGGAFTYAGKKKGAYRVDLMTVKAGVPSLVVGLTLEKPGPWSTELPKGLDKVDVMAYVDVDGKGPSATDPMGVLEGVPVSKANSAVDVTVTDPTGK